MKGPMLHNDMEATLREYRRAIELAHKHGQEQTRLLLREFARHDLFFLIYHIFGRTDIAHPWLFARCREVQNNPNGYLDLWAREHYKSTIITYGMTIKDILNNPETTAGIFSFNRPIAQAFLKQIKRELEYNQRLLELFPDVLYRNPKKGSPKWSEDEGIIVKRRTNPKESTVEAFGLVDGQPTSRHYNLVIYNDVVTKESVATPYMIEKTTDAWENSLNLGTRDGVTRYEGTRWHYNDTYKTIIDRGAAIPRIYPGTHNGKPDGKPVFLLPDVIARKRKDMGPYTFACQILQDPKAEDTQGFREEWISYWKAMNYTGLNMYILCDPANEKKRENDYTVFWVIGLGPDRNYYVVTIVRDRLNLTERANVLFKLHREYRPLAVGYEKYGMQADIEHYKTKMERENYRFGITELGGLSGKNDRIRRLVPKFERGCIYLPESCVRENYEGVREDLVKVFINDEYLAFPFPTHDDMLDSLSRILDEELGAVFPEVREVSEHELKIAMMRENRELKNKEEQGNDEDDDGEYNPLMAGMVRR